MRQKQQDELDTFFHFARTHEASDPSPFFYKDNALSPEEAFYEVTARGQKRVATTDPWSAGMYYVGQKIFNLTFALWKNDIHNGLLDKNELIEYYSSREGIQRYITKRLAKVKEET